MFLAIIWTLGLFLRIVEATYLHPQGPLNCPKGCGTFLEPLKGPCWVLKLSMRIFKMVIVYVFQTIDQHTNTDAGGLLQGNTKQIHSPHCTTAGLVLFIFALFLFF